MAYMTYEQFQQFNSDISVTEFNKYEGQAERIIDAQTTGIDNVCKLKVAFPTDEDAIRAVQICLVELTEALKNIADLEASSLSKELQAGGSIASMSSGSESVSFSSGGGTSYSVAVNDFGQKLKLYGQIVRSNLSGITDKNGVNLLYMGRYPLCIKIQ